MVSFIIPIYNSEKTLHNCIQSILNQNNNDFEIILINDGSTDKSGEICNYFANKDSRIKVFHFNNRGVSSARNVGLENARGEWIAFIDSDDCINNDYCGTIRNTKADIIFFSWGEYYNGILKAKHLFNDIFFEGDSISDMFEKTNIGLMGYPWGKIYRRDIINRYSLRFNELLSISEDRLFFYQYMLYIQSASFKSYLGYNYNLSNTGLSKTKHTYNMYKYRLVELDKASANLVERKKLKWNSIQPLMYFQIIYLTQLMESKENKKKNITTRYKSEFKLFLNSKLFEHVKTNLFSFLRFVQSKFGLKLYYIFLLNLFFHYFTISKNEENSNHNSHLEGHEVD